MAELWRRSAETLRGQFEQASYRHPDLHFMHVEFNDDARRYAEGPSASHWRREQPVAHKEIFIGAPRSLRPLTDAEIESTPADATNVMRDPGTGRALAAIVPGTIRASYYWGDAASLDHFLSLATGVGRLLPSMPQSATRLIPPEVLWGASRRQEIGNWVVDAPPDMSFHGREYARWLLAVFNIAWLALPASPLRARRQTWIDNHVLPADESELRILKTHGLMPDVVGRVQIPPDHFFSILPFNLFLSSVLALDVLLDIDPAPAPEPLSPGSLHAWAGAAEGHFGLVFTDVKGGTKLRKEIGADAMAELTAAHFALARKYTRQHGGHVVKFVGDQVIALFRTATQALDFSLAFSADTGDNRIPIRAGIHVGPLLIRDNDIEGEAPAFCARMLSVSKEADLRVSDVARREIDERKAGAHASLAWRELTAALKDFAPDERLWIVERKKHQPQTGGNVGASKPVPPRPSLGRRGGNKGR